MLGLLLLSLSWAGNADARDQLVRFVAPSDGDLAGFRIYEGPTPAELAFRDDIGPVALVGIVGWHTVVGLDDAADTYLAVSAYDFAGNESPLSEPLFSAGGVIDPPPVGVLLDEDFDSRVGATPVPDWSPYTLGQPTAVPFFFPVDGPVGRVEVTFGPGPTQLVYAGAGSEDWVDYDYEGRMALGDSNGAVGVTVYGAPPASYFLLRGWGGSTFQLSLTDGAGTLGGTCTGRNDTGVSVDANVWYRFRVRVENVGVSVVVLAKVWEEGELEPVHWPAICLTAPPTPVKGTVGLWSMRLGSAPNAWDDLTVDTDLEVGPSSPDCDDDLDCDDGNACTGVETCVSGSCSSGGSLVCAGSNECQVGACDPQVGCVYTDLSGTTCGNDDFCDGVDVCIAGACQTFISSVCQAQYVCGDPYCDSELGICGKTEHADGTPCSDGAINGTCMAGVCRPPCQASVDCNDGNLCNGFEYCAANECRARPDLPDGLSCITAGSQPGTCNTGWCTP